MAETRGVGVGVRAVPWSKWGRKRKAPPEPRHRTKICTKPDATTRRVPLNQRANITCWHMMIASPPNPNTTLQGGERETERAWVSKALPTCVHNMGFHV